MNTVLTQFTKEFRELANATFNLILIFSFWCIKLVICLYLFAKLCYLLGVYLRHPQIYSQYSQTSSTLPPPVLPAEHCTPLLPPTPTPQTLPPSLPPASPTPYPTMTIKQLPKLSSSTLPTPALTSQILPPLLPPASPPPYQTMTINQLRKLCKQKGLSPNRWSKVQCIHALQTLET